MNEAKTTQPQIGTWEKLSTQEVEITPKVNFDVNIPVECTFREDNPREYVGDNGAYYVFDVTVNGENRAIVTSAWTLLRVLKMHSPLKGKSIIITKKLIKGKQQFEGSLKV